MNRAILLGILSALLFVTPLRAEVKPAATQPAATDFGQEAYRLVANKDEIVSVLKNGLTVIIKRVQTPAVSVQALVNTGSIYENKWLGGGLSHLCEHLVAGGSSSRRTEAQNLDLLQQIGDNSNAYTSYEQTVYFVNTTPEHVEKAIDLVTDWVFGATITPEEYDREYQVVQRELEKDAGEADWVFADLFMENRYLVHPARYPVIGYQEVIRSLKRDEVYEYFKSAYVPQNVIISVAGNGDPEAMLAAVRKNVGNVKPARIPGKALPEEPPVDSPRTQVATFPGLGQAKLSLGFESVRSTDPDMYAMDLLAATLGLGESSILVQDLRDTQHLVSAIVCADDTPYYVKGTFSVEMDVAPDKIKAATEATLAILEKVKHDGVSEDRLQRAKTMIRAAEAMNKQTAENVASTAAANFLHTGNPDDTYADRIGKVTADQVRAAANKYLNVSKLLTTALLPEDSAAAAGLPKATALMRRAVPTTARAPVAESSPLITRVVLPNNTVLLLKRVATTPVVSVQLFSRGGLSTEDAKTNGLGNLAMRTVPRGSKSRSAEEIATFFDSIGGTIETTCANNTFVWSATCLRDDFGKLIPAFADLVNEPAFPDAELMEMKERVQAEIGDQDRDWMGGGRRFFNKVFFEPGGSPYQFSVLGTKESVAAFTPAQVRDYYQKTILTGPRVLAIFGDIDVAAAQVLAAKYLGDGEKVQPGLTAPPASVDLPEPKDLTPQLRIARVEVQKWDNPESAVFVGFKADVVDGEPAAAQLLMADTLTSGYSYPTGYIFETLRGLGLVYDANAQNFWGRSPRQPGTFWAYGACDAKNVNAVADGILLQIARLQGTDDDIDLKWFSRSKKMLEASDALQNETASAQAYQVMIDEINGNGYSFHGSFDARIDAVTPQQVRDVGRRRLRECVITISTSHPELVTIKAGDRKYESFPRLDLTPKGIQHDTGGK